MKKTLLIVVGLFVFANGLPAQTHDDSFTQDGLFKADVNQLKDTQLVVSPEMPLEPTKNVLWCGTLQLAWNEATALVGEPMVFDRPSLEVAMLNRGKFNRHDLDPTSYVAIADFERNQVEAEIRAALEKTFHGAASPELIPPVPTNPGPDDFVAYSYLYKNLAFARPFNDGSMLFGDTPVQDFGFNQDAEDRPLDQVKIHDYQSDDDFVVELKTTSPDDQLILAKVAPGVTLQATIHEVLQRLTRPREDAGVADSLSVPKLNFDLRRDFQELEGLILTPSPTAKMKGKLVISKAQQLVRFQLNEKGAVLKSEAVIEMKALAMRSRYHLVFDKPFLILLKQTKSRQPYFALWVGNASLLVPEKK